MKKYLITGVNVCVLCLFAFTGFSQTGEFIFNGGANVNFRYPPSGNGGRALVHNTNNTFALNYMGDFSGGTTIGNGFWVGNEGDIKLPDGKAINGSFFRTNDYSTMSFFSRAWGSVQGVNGKAFSFQTHYNNGNAGLEMMAIYYGESGKIVMAPTGGLVGIGTSNPTEILSVNGKIRAHEIKIEITGWPDYVFSKKYQLIPLIELEQFIDRNHHLPEIPSAHEVEKDGLNLGEMNKKLLQKVEELTLYLIEQNKKVNTLEEIIKRNNLK